MSASQSENSSQNEPIPSGENEKIIRDILDGFKLEVYRDGFEPMVEELVEALDAKDAALNLERAKALEEAAQVAMEHRCDSHVCNCYSEITTSIDALKGEK